MIESVRPDLARVAAPPPPAFTHEAGPVDASEVVRGRVESFLGPTAVPVDELVRLADARAGEVQLILLELELSGRIERHAGGRVSAVAA